MPDITLNSATLYYQRYGQSGQPTLLLSHSLFFDHSMFDPLVSLLSAHFDLLVYDHRGQGLSSRDGPLDMDQLAEDAAELIVALGLAPCYVAGNSMGGFVALRLAARHPQLLAGCIVMGSSADLEHNLAAFEPLVESLAVQGTAAHIDALMYIMFGDRSLADPEAAAMLAHWRSKMQGLGTGIAAAASAVIHRTSLIDELADVSVPLLVLAGEQDHAYSVALSEQIVHCAGHGELRVISGAGHSVALEAPQQVADALIAFAKN